MKNSGLNVVYARVSTDEQRKVGFSVIDQINEGISFAKREGFEVDMIFKDDGFSASNLKRPDIQKLLKLVSENKISKIIVRHSDRLVRDLILQRSLQTIFTMFKVEIVCLHSDWDNSTPEKSFTTDLQGLLNETELKKIRPRTLKGLRGSASSGNYAIGGKPPLGYKRKKNKRIGKGSYLAIKKEEAEIIVKIFNTLASNRVTVTDMVKYLNKNKILERKWNVKQLFRLLDNPIYYGKFEQEWYEQENHTKPIVTKEVWFQVQSIIHKKKRSVTNFYLYRRLVFCEDCEVFTTLDCSHKKRKQGVVIYKYYCCPKCKQRINENKISKFFIKDYALHKANVLDKHYIINLENKILKKKKRIDLLNNDFDNGLLDEHYYKDELKKLYKDIKKLNKEILEFNSADYEHFENLTEMQKRAMILSNVVKISISYIDDRINVKYRINDVKQKK